jgi:hypothetical protein
MVEDPEFVARTSEGVAGPRETVKVCGGGGGCTVTVTGVVLESVFGVVPVEPVIVRVKLAGVGTAVQLTVKTVVATLAVQPVGAALVENVTVPENALIAVNDSVEVCAGPLATTVSEDGLADTEKSTTWNLTGGDEVTVCVGLPPVPVTVAV